MYKQIEQYIDNPIKIRSVWKKIQRNYNCQEVINDSTVRAKQELNFLKKQQVYDYNKVVEQMTLQDIKMKNKKNIMAS